MSLDPSAGNGLLGIFMPACNVPLYQMDSNEVASQCGRYSGLMSAGGVAILAFIVAGVYAFYAWQKAKSDPKYKPAISTTVAWLIAIGVSLVAWVGLPPLMSYYQSQKWTGYQLQIKNLMSQGMTKIQALDQMGLTARANLAYAGQSTIANAITGAAAGGIASSNGAFSSSF
jgi:hypothetical protein